MISFICCYINPDNAEKVRLNIEQTIGNTPFEWIPFDNRLTKYGICKVYNMCAQKASHPNLCFLHEDVAFQGNNWSKNIVNKLSDPTCGVIGFAGSTIKVPQLTEWRVSHKTSYINVIQHFKHRKRNPKHHTEKFSQPFAEVITLDGLAMFVRRDVWSEIRFDETTFTAFHFYDLDFSLAVSQKYHNYVTNTPSIEHFSEGSYDLKWLTEAKKMQEKWNSILPIATCGNAIYNKQRARYIEMRLLLRLKYFKHSYKEICKLIIQQPLHFKTWLLLFKNIKYANK